MALIVRVFSGLACFALAAVAQAGTELTINRASVNVGSEELILEGLNFPVDGSLAIRLGDTLLAGCVVESALISCPIAQTPALSGGTWTVRISAGNAPHQNASIDVYVLASGAGCNIGDYVSCYPGDLSEVGVGNCRAGVRMCGAGGAFGACVGHVTPVAEFPDNCGDSIDNDCDGVVDNACDTLVDNPTYFRVNQGLAYTFSVPPDVSALHIIAVGGGGSGGHNFMYAGGGGGSGGYSELLSYAVSPGDQFSVYLGDFASDPFSGGESSVTKEGVKVVWARGGESIDFDMQGGAGGLGQTLNGLPGGVGASCTTWPSNPTDDVHFVYVEGGQGGESVFIEEPYHWGRGQPGWGGTCVWVCISGVCQLSEFRSDWGNVDPPAGGEPGMVKVWWDAPSQ